MPKKKLKQYILLFVASIILLIIGIINHRENDKFLKIYSENDYVVKSGACEMNDEHKIRLWCPDSSKETVVATPQFAVEKGEYQIGLSYQSTSNENRIRVLGVGVYDEKNQDAGILLDVDLPLESEELKIPITFERNYERVEIQLIAREGELLAGKCEMGQEKFFNDSISLSVVLILILFILVLVYAKSNPEKKIEIIVSAFAIAIAFLPFMNDFLIKGHDLTIHLAHIEGIMEGLRNGEFPVRISSVQAHGYGYAMPVLYPDIFLYIPAVLRLMGISSMVSYKLFIGIIHTAAYLIAYYSIKRLLNSNKAGLLFAVIYTLCSYRLVTCYERAALGELLAMTFFPLVFLGMYEILQRDCKKWYLASIGMACILQSHLLSAFLTGEMILVVVLWRIYYIRKEKERFLALLKAGLLCLGLSAFTLVPVLSYMRLPLQVGREFPLLHESAVYASQMFQNLWGDGTRGNLGLGTTMGEMPLTIGAVLLFGTILFLIERKQCIEKEEWYQLGVFSFITGAVALFFASWLCPWESLQKISIINQLFSKIQFAFRFLMLTSFLWSITTTIGIICFLNKQENKKESSGRSDTRFVLVSLGIIACSFLFLSGTEEKETIANKADLVGVCDTDELYLYGESNLSGFKDAGDRIITDPSVEIRIENRMRKGSSQSFDYEILSGQEETIVDMPIAYYPGYVVKCDGEVLHTALGNEGRLQVVLHQKSGSVQIRFMEKPLWILGDVLSLLTWSIIIIYMVKQRGKVREDS